MEGSIERIKSTLETWQNWEAAEPLTAKPSLGRRFAQGSGHTLYEINDCLDLVLRVRHQKTSMLPGGFDREIKIWSKAAAQRAAPKLVYVDKKNHTVVCQKAHVLKKPPDARQLIALMSRIHSITPCRWSLDLHYQMRRYLCLIPRSDRINWQTLVNHPHTASAISIIEEDAQYVCHNDLTTGNIMCQDDGILLAIDWEYAAVGSRYFDAAIAMDGKRPHYQKSALESLFGRDFDPDLFLAGRYLASLTNALWYQVYQPNSAPDPSRLNWLKMDSYDF